MKYRIITALAIAALLSFAACKSVTDHVGGVTVGGDYNTTNGAVGGTIGITFKDTAGSAKSITIAPVGRGQRGFDTGGKFVTLGEIKTTAIAAYKAHQSGSEAGRLKGYNGFDCDTVAIIVASLTSYHADPNSL